MSEGLCDEDGVDGPFERRMKRAMRDDERASRERQTPTPVDPVALHCICGASSPDWGAPIAGGAEEARSDAIRAFTSAWWRVHCGPGHSPSDQHVVLPSDEEVLASAFEDDGGLA